VSAGALLKAGTGGEKADRRSASVSSNTETSGGIGEAVSNFSLDIGPMITIAVLNFVINRLDEYAAGVVLENVKDKDEKRAFKKFFGGKKKPRTEKDVAVAASQDPSENVHAGFDTTNRDSEYVYGYEDGESTSAGRSDSYGASRDERDGADSTEPTPSDKPSHTSASSAEQANENKLGNSDGFDLSTLTSAERPAYVTHQQAAASGEVYTSASSKGVSSKENDGEGWLD